MPVMTAAWAAAPGAGVQGDGDKQARGKDARGEDEGPAMADAGGGEQGSAGNPGGRAGCLQSWRGGGDDRCYEGRRRPRSVPMGCAGARRRRRCRGCRRLRGRVGWRRRWPARRRGLARRLGRGGQRPGRGRRTGSRGLPWLAFGGKCVIEGAAGHGPGLPRRRGVAVGAGGRDDDRRRFGRRDGQGEGRGRATWTQVQAPAWM